MKMELLGLGSRVVMIVVDIIVVLFLNHKTVDIRCENI